MIRWLFRYRSVLGLGVAIVGAGLALALFLPNRPPDAVFELLHAGLRMYTNESKGERYPPCVLEPRPFSFSADVLDVSGDARETLERFLADDICYTGYLLYNEHLAKIFLDEFERGSLSGGEDIEFEHTRLFPDRPWLPGVYGRAAILHLREGIERYCIHEIGNPFAAPSAQAKIPLLWQMPDCRRVSGGWVFYLDGHAEWLRYPGPFPMNPNVIQRLRKMMGPPAKSGGNSIAQAPRWYGRPKPETNPLPEVLKDCEPLRSLRIDASSEADDVQFRGERGFRLRSDLGELLLFPDRSQETAHLSDPPSSQDAALPERPGGEDSAFLDLGVGYGYRWFLGGGAGAWEFFRTEFAFDGGDDWVAAAERSKVPWLAVRQGDRAVPYLQGLLRDTAKVELHADALLALDAIGTESAKRVIQSVFAEDNPKADENALRFIEDDWWYYGYYNYYPWARPEYALELAVTALRRDRSADDLIKLSVEWVLKYGQGKGSSNATVAAARQIVAGLPREARAKPLAKLLGRPPSERERDSWRRFLESLETEAW